MNSFFKKYQPVIFNCVLLAAINFGYAWYFGYVEDSLIFCSIVILFMAVATGASYLVQKSNLHSGPVIPLWKHMRNLALYALVSLIFTKIGLKF